MKKIASSAEALLDQLGELSCYLGNITSQDHRCFDRPLQIINQAMGFHISVLYKISNVIENDLILEVMSVCNPEHIRPDLAEGAKICLNIAHPPAEFSNEVMAYKRGGVSASNVPGWGCDMVGSIYLPENLGRGYLLAGDFFGDESDICEHEIRVCEIMCNMLSSALMRTRFEQLASYDGLTGLLNSRAIREALEKTFQRHRRKMNAPGAVVLADIDFFKKINDEYGHIQGDSVLQEVGEIFDTAMRKHLDLAGRYGGEEFLLIYEDTEAEQVASIIERLRLCIDKHRFARVGAEGEFLHVTMSFGIAPLGGQLMKNSREILSMADAALYRSKACGRNRVTLG